MTTAASSTTSTGPARRRDYYDDVDFDDLARRDPAWAIISRRAKREGFVDFQNPNVVQQLTKTIAKCDFNLTLDLPPDRLCPPVPVRWNYVRWLQDILATTSDTLDELHDPQREIVGLDIGVGASCVYALLACAVHPNWRMVGTDVDTHSLACARRNVHANHLEARIKLKQTEREDPLLALDLMGIEELDFVMTNPPFYSSAEDMQASYNDKTAAPSAVCTGAQNEMICSGGDLGFVSRILEESLVLRKRVHWYTAMFGRLQSVRTFVAQLKGHHITNYAFTELRAGYRTKRWVVAWSFRDYRPRYDISCYGALPKALLPSPTAKTIKVYNQDAAWAGRKVDVTMKALDVQWMWRSSLHVGVMQCEANVWGRAARRRRKFQAVTVDHHAESDEGAEDESNDDSEVEASVALVAKITCTDGEVELRWLRGDDWLIFESFGGMLKTALTGRK